MKHKLLAAFAASALILMTFAPAGTGAASPNTRGFHRVDISKIDPSVLKKILASKDVDVIVQLDGAAASEQNISNDKKKVVAKQLKVRQDKLDAAIKKLGGRVDAKYQYAYNGIKVRAAEPAGRALSRLAGVTAIHAVPTYKYDNSKSVPFLSSQAVWQDYGDTGQGQTIAIIDTGIDYTHANFGGEGTEAAYDDNDPTVIETDSFPTAKVIGGWDFVGNDYEPGADGAADIPAPDPDPLDCNGHGSHVAGSAAGFGVKSDHTTYTGAYNATTYGPRSASARASRRAPRSSPSRCSAATAERTS